MARPAPTVSVIRRHLAARLPDFIIPSACVVLDALPLNDNAKVDRRALPAPGPGRPALDPVFVEPQNLLQYELARIWEALLGVQPVGVRDDFFDLGGHSLLAVRMMDEVERALGRRVPPSVMLSGSTIEHLAGAIQMEATDLLAPVVPVQAGAGGPPFFFLHGDYLSGGFFTRSLARHLGEDQPVYALPPCGLDGGPVPPSYEAMAERHVVAMRSVQPRGPYRLGGLCNGGLVAFEVARLLEREGQKVDLLVPVAASAVNPRFGWLSAIRRIPRRLRLRSTGVVRGSLASIPSQENPAPSADDARRRLREAYLRLDHLYSPRTYGGRVTLFWPSEDPVPAREAARCWRRVAREVSVRVVPGSHITCLTAHVESAAGELRRCLQERVPA
jgi:thioesterase domain-containing protein/acyl carrier protein